MIASLVAAVALAAADPCAPLDAATPDPAAAAAYRSVAEAEAARGARDTAILAYRSAASLDPEDRASRAALARSCGQGAPVDRFQRGLTRMDAGDLRGAVGEFHAARAGDDDPSIALLEGICHYELGEDRDAEEPLRVAERSPDSADLARFYLGLVALRQGSASRAASLFDEASASAAVAPVALDLARLARAQGRWAVTLEAASGFDSNVNLAPSGAAPASVTAPGAWPARRSDGLYAFGATGVLRPWGGDGPYLRAKGLLDQQFQLGGFDTAGLDGAAGWQLRADRWAGLAEYDYAYRTFGGSPFLSAHRLLVSAWTAFGDLTVGATYFARFESYHRDFSPFSGTVQGGEGRTSFGVGSRTRLALAYGLARDSADGRDTANQPILSYLEQGPRAELRVVATRTVRLGVDLAATFRSYDAFDASLGVRRRDTYLDGAAVAEWDVRPGWTARATLQARHAFSNAPALEYDKLVPTFGLAYTISP